MPARTLLMTQPAAGGGASFTFLDSGSTGDGNLNTVYTWSALDFGSAASDRVLVAALGLRVSKGATDISVTIGGVSATVDVRTSTWPAAAIARAEVPTGTSGDVVVTFTGARNTERGPMAMALYGVNGTVSVDTTASDYTNTTTLSSTSVSNSSGATIIAAASSSELDGSQSFAWSASVTEDVLVTDGVRAHASLAHANDVSAGPTTVSVTSGSALFQGLAVAAYTIA